MVEFSVSATCYLTKLFACLCSAYFECFFFDELQQLVELYTILDDDENKDKGEIKCCLVKVMQNQQ